VPDTLDYERLARVVDGVLRAVVELPGVRVRAPDSPLIVR
jgi:hypothetical protein